MTKDEVIADLKSRDVYMNEDHVKVSWETTSEGGDATKYKFYIEEYSLDYDLRTKVPFTTKRFNIKTKFYIDIDLSIWNTLVKEICDKRDNLKKLQAKL